MKLFKRGRTLIVSRCTGDKSMTNESAFWFALQKEINQLDGVDMVKRPLTLDGHMTSNGIYYLRDRHWKYAIMDVDAALRCAAKTFNRGEVELHTVDWDGVVMTELLSRIPTRDRECAL